MLQEDFERRRGRRYTGFSAWLTNRVSEMDRDGLNPDLSLVTLSRLPSPTVKHFPSMWAYGYHLRPDDEQGRSNVTFDSGVAAIITQVCRSSRADRNPVEASLDYVGIIKDIVQVDYGIHKFAALKCSWIKPNLEGHPTIRRDEHGFWSVKYGARQSPVVEPYVFPNHIQQVLDKNSVKIWLPYLRTCYYYVFFMLPRILFQYLHIQVTSSSSVVGVLRQ